MEHGTLMRSLEHGILIAEDSVGGYQIVGAVASLAEAAELADNYERFAVEGDNVAPERFVIHQRGEGGWYNRREVWPSFPQRERYIVERADGREVSVSIPEKK